MSVFPRKLDFKLQVTTRLQIEGHILASVLDVAAKLLYFRAITDKLIIGIGRVIVLQYVAPSKPGTLDVLRTRPATPILTYLITPPKV
jgi:hypothetical protein